MKKLAIAVMAVCAAMAAHAGVSFRAAKPVWPAGLEGEMNCHVGFRGEFDWNGGEVKLRLTGSSIFRVYVNGAFACYGPARGPKGWFRVDEWDLSRFVKRGRNVLAVEAQAYNAPNYYIMAHPGFLQLEVFSGGRILLAGDGMKAYRTERVQKVVRYSFQRAFSECYRVGKDWLGWMDGRGEELALRVQPAVKLLERGAPYPAFEIDSSYRPAAALRVSRDEAAAKRNPGRVITKKSALGGKAFDPEELEYDAFADYSALTVAPSAGAASALPFRLAADSGLRLKGARNATGFIRVKAKVAKPGRLMVCFDETLVDGKLDFISRFGCCNVVTWNVAEPGEYEFETFEPYTLQYAEAFMVGGEAELEGFELRTYKNPSAGAGRYLGRDPALARIFEAARETFAQNAVDVFTDCPSRERAGWLCDSYFTGPAERLFTGGNEMERTFLRNFGLAESFPALPEGMVAMCYPGDHTNGNFIPNWSMWFILELANYVERTGDRATAAFLRPRVEGLIRFYARYLNRDGLLENLPAWVFVEWSHANELPLVKGVNYPSNMTYSEVLDKVAALYGRRDLAVQAARLRETIRAKAFDGVWFRDEAAHPDVTETCQYYAFFHGVATPELHPELWRRLTTEFGPERKKKGLHPEVWPSNAFIGNLMRMEILSRAGLHEQVVRELRGYYLGMAEKTGTLWEHDAPHASCDHGFASYVAVLINRAEERCSGALRAGFIDPPKSSRPETWYHFINGNVTREGVSADLEAIAAAGISGVQLFHGGGIGVKPWPGVKEQLDCLSEKWDDCVRFVADEAHRCGLTFKMQNCPGWSMAGGPWIKVEDAMRSIAWSVSFSRGGKVAAPLPPVATDNADRDWRDLLTVAFPRPAGDGEEMAAKQTLSLRGGRTLVWEAAAPAGGVFTARTLELPCVQAMCHARSYDPEVTATLAVEEKGAWRDVRSWRMPRSNWQDDQPLSLAVPETTAARFRVTVECPAYAPKVPAVRLLGRARPHNWESESANCLRSLMHDPACTNVPGAYVDPKSIRVVAAGGELPPGDWTVLRIGHVNTLRSNGPAPKEATGWECDKLSAKGIEKNFAGYVGRLAKKGGVLEGRLDGMLLDSWECCCQTWTPGMDGIFASKWGYALADWWPALCGYVVGDRERTALFYRDWRVNISDLVAKNFYGRMGELAHEQGFTVAFETACGDVFPGDILEYYKGADVPMCEFWRGADRANPHWIENPEFKPFRPTVSAARLYGKPRVDAEALTGGLSWDEDLRDFKWHVDRAYGRGVTHMVFQTYTHNPLTNGLPPSASFGDWGIGTPFLRLQTWWRHMPAFTRYLARCTWMLENGRSRAAVLYYLGDEQDHKPRECESPVPDGYEYDYLNPDGLLNEVEAAGGRWRTRAGLEYDLIYVGDNRRMRPATLRKLREGMAKGAEVVGLPGDGRSVGEVLAARGVKPDVELFGGRAFWQHRRGDGRDWYFVAPADGRAVVARFAADEGREAEIWNPRTGEIRPARGPLFEIGETVFVVFGRAKGGWAPPAVRTAGAARQEIVGDWRIDFPKGWGRDAPVVTRELKPWKDLPGSAEAKAFSGTATYALDFTWMGGGTVLHLPNLKGVAAVRVNGRDAGCVWCEPMTLDLAGLLRRGANRLELDVTTPWFNRLVHDAGLPEAERRTWTLVPPQAGQPLRDSGLMGPVWLD